MTEGFSLKVKMTSTLHRPVLLKEMIEYLRPLPGDTFVDATLGFGGHSSELLKAIEPKGKLLALDWDKESIKAALPNLPQGENLLIAVANFKDIQEIAEATGFPKVSGILFDLGLSLWQLKESGRGFSFEKDDPLDMRLNPAEQSLTAYQVVNRFSQKELFKILKDSDEKYAHQIAKQVVEARKNQPLRSTFALRQIVEEVYGQRGRYNRFRKIHPATQTFQAIRVVVNQELENLREGLKGGAAILKKGGRLAIISFHSGEDRIVKHFFKENPNLKVLTKKPIRPTEEEIRANPRSRSAKLRVAEKK